MVDESTVWNACVSGDLDRLKAMIAENPSVIWQRGAVGEGVLLFCCLLRHHHMVDWLLKHNPEQGLTQYIGDQCSRGPNANR